MPRDYYNNIFFRAVVVVAVLSRRADRTFRILVGYRCVYKYAAMCSREIDWERCLFVRPEQIFTISDFILDWMETKYVFALFVPYFATPHSFVRDFVFFFRFCTVQAVDSTHHRSFACALFYHIRDSIQFISRCLPAGSASQSFYLALAPHFDHRRDFHTTAKWCAVRAVLRTEIINYSN